MSELTVQVLAPSKIILQNHKAREVNAPGSLGYLGVLPGHADLICELKEGSLRVIGADSKQFEISGGYLEVSKDLVQILVEDAKPANT